MDIAKFIKETIENILNIDEGVVPTAKLSDLCMDEMDVMDLVVAVEDEMRIMVSSTDEDRLIGENVTVQDVIDLFTKLSQPPQSYPPAVRRPPAES